MVRQHQGMNRIQHEKISDNDKMQDCSLQAQLEADDINF